MKEKGDILGSRQKKASFKSCFAQDVVTTGVCAPFKSGQKHPRWEAVAIPSRSHLASNSSLSSGHLQDARLLNHIMFQGNENLRNIRSPSQGIQL